MKRFIRRDWFETRRPYREPLIHGRDATNDPLAIGKVNNTVLNKTYTRFYSNMNERSTSFTISITCVDSNRKHTLVIVNKEGRLLRM